MSDYVATTPDGRFEMTTTYSDEPELTVLRTRGEYTLRDGAGIFSIERDADGRYFRAGHPEKWKTSGDFVRSFVPSDFVLCLPGGHG